MIDTDTTVLDRIANYRKDTDSIIRDKLCEHCPEKERNCPCFNLRRAENKYIASCNHTKTTLWHWPQGYKARGINETDF